MAMCNYLVNNLISPQIIKGLIPYPIIILKMREKKALFFFFF